MRYSLIFMRIVKITIILSVLLLTFGTKAQSQSAQEIDALNAYINFLNESVHGMVIAHILLVNNNKDLNRYIDLDATKTVNLTTEDLPTNIFDKPDDNSDFYEISPIELSEICFQKSRNLKSDLASSFNRQTREIVKILNRLNQLRFDIENYILDNDLSQKESIYGVYNYLEEAVALFEDYSIAHNKMAKEINKVFDFSDDDVYRALKLIHGTTKEILNHLRKEQEDQIEGKATRLSSTLTVYKAALSNAELKNEYTESIRDKALKVIDMLKLYLNPDIAPYEDELYGKHYYYHNQILIKYFNWSGPGFVRDMNSLMEGLDVPFIKLDEEPLIFKVIYPTKVEKARELEVRKAALSVPVNKVEPTFKIEPPVEKVQGPQRDIFDFELYDPKMNDRDSINIFFNGEKIMDNYMLSRTEKTFSVELDPSQSNIIKFEAVNYGIIPYNTIAVRYRYRGKRESILRVFHLKIGETQQITLEVP